MTSREFLLCVQCTWCINDPFKKGNYDILGKTSYIKHFPIYPVIQHKMLDVSIYNKTRKIKLNGIWLVVIQIFIFFSRIVEKINLKLCKNLPMEVCRKNLALTFFCAHALHWFDISFKELLHRNDITLYWWSVICAL